MSDVVWLHDGSLGPEAAPLQRSPGAPAVFVFDQAWIEREGLTLKRLVFIYECLEALDVTIFQGDVVAAVRAFAADQGASRILAQRTPDPRLRRQGEELRVTWCEPPPLVELPRGADLKRFSRYWRKAQATAFGA